MTRESRSERGRMRYGMCLNDQCSKCKTKEVQPISARKEMICEECGKPLRECPPPSSPVNWKMIITIAAVIILGGIAGAYFALKKTPASETGNPLPTTVNETEEKQETEVNVESMSIAEGKALQLKVGDKKQLTLVLAPENNNEQIAWRTSDLSIAKISEEGIVEAIAKGQTTITAVTDRSGNAVSVEVTIVENRGVTDTWKSNYAKYEGDLKDGKPHGNGTMTFTRKAIIPGAKGDIEAQPGEYVQGAWRNGEVNLVTLFQKDGNQVKIMHK